MRNVLPHGSWASPIDSRTAARGGIDLHRGPLLLDAQHAYWIEGRPENDGRPILVRGDLEGIQVDDLTASPFHPRTRVHEYGGGDFTLAAGSIYFTNEEDQRLYRLTANGRPAALTAADKRRYADMVVDAHRRRVVCVCEDHSSPQREARNVLLSLDARAVGPELELVTDRDFVAAPRPAPDGKSLAWLAWNHPNMPWDGTELWVAELDAEGQLVHPQRIAGGPRESIAQPEWSPEGTLHFISDRTGWWNLYRWTGTGTEALFELDADFASPQWTLGPSSYGFPSPRRMICSYTREGTWHLILVDLETLRRTPLRTPYTSVEQVRAGQDVVVFRGASATEPTSIVCLRISGGRTTVLRRSRSDLTDRKHVSIPRVIRFRTRGGDTARALFYPPTNGDFVAPEGEKPPLLVTGHGGPTAAASAALDVKVQFWTSRGFAYVDVDYRGSSGYGRPYREALYGQWGIADVEDCVDAALHLAEQGLVDRHRLAIRGRSAGGFTALCALTFHDVFAAGASYYGISDLEALARETHKFEAHYTERLVGPYPERRDLYRARSPIRFVDRLSCPVVLLQGLKDRVVPPDQAEAMATALRRKGLAVAHVTFAEEGHGFRRPETVRRALDAELFFYSRVFGFEVGDALDPVPIDNL